MKISILLLGGAALLALGSCAESESSRTAAQPTTQGKAMEAMLADVNQIRAYVYGSGTTGTAEQSATDLLAWSQRMAELFPPSEASEEYVDMSPERAAHAPAAMIGTSQMLLAAVQTGNRALIGTRLDQTEKEGCGACHLSTSP